MKAAIRTQVRAAFNGHAIITEAAPLVSEYLTRLKLAKIGYRFDPAKIDAEKADGFVIVADEIEKAEADETKKRAKKKGR